MKLLDESVKDKPQLKSTLSTFRALRRIFTAVRQTYLEEAAMLERPSLDRAALDRIYDRRVAAFKQIQPERR